VKGYLDALEDILRGVAPSVGTARPLRLTVTGSRDGWVPIPPTPLVECFRTVYDWYGRDVRLGHGAARGIDMAADALGRRARWQIMPYKVTSAEWTTYKGYAGHRRNARMLEAEAPDLVLAFIWRGSRGSTGCADNATARGIPVIRIDEELALIPRASAML
jgi:hypothetical protein